MEDPSLSPRDRGLAWSQHFRGYQGTHLLTTHYRTTTRGGTATPLPYSSTMVGTWFFGTPDRRRTLTTPRRLEGSNNSRFSISGPRTPCLRALTVNGLLLPGSVATRVETLPPGIGTFVGSRRYRSVMGQHMVTPLRSPGDRHFVEKDYGEGCELIGEIKPQLP